MIIFKIFYNLKSLIYQKEQHQAIRPTVIWLHFFFQIFYETDASMMRYLLCVCMHIFVCVCGQIHPAIPLFYTKYTFKWDK